MLRSPSHTGNSEHLGHSGHFEHLGHPDDPPANRFAGGIYDSGSVPKRSSCEPGGGNGLAGVGARHEKSLICPFSSTAGSSTGAAAAAAGVGVGASGLIAALPPEMTRRNPRPPGSSRE